MIDYLAKLPPLTDFERELIGQKVDVDAKYKLPSPVKYCKKCVISNQRPRITFDSEGVCSACRYWEKKKSAIDCDYVLRSHIPTAYCNQNRCK